MLQKLFFSASRVCLISIFRLIGTYFLEFRTQEWCIRAGTVPREVRLKAGRRFMCSTMIAF